MGSTNYGGQNMTVSFNADAADYSFNKRFLNIVPPGIFKGGLLKLVTTTTFKLMPLVCDITDSSLQYQVRIETTTDEQFTADVSNPWVALRWNYSPLSGQNYMDVILTATPDSYPGRLIVGKCLFSGSDLTGFTYGEGEVYKRNVPDLAEYHFKALGNSAVSPDSRYMWFAGGNIPDIDGGGNITKTLEADTRYVSFPVESLEKTYYVYLNRSLDPTYPQASLTYPNGKQYIVIAKAVIPAGGDPVTLSQITDLRRYIW